MLRTSPLMNCSQISAEIPLLLVIMNHRGWDGEEHRRAEKGRDSQESVILPCALYGGNTPSYLPSGWPLALPSIAFASHWEQLQNSTLHLLPTLWNPFWILLQHHSPQVRIRVPILHGLYPLPSSFPHNLVAQAQSFRLGATSANLLTTSTLTVPIIIAPTVDEHPWDTPQL